MGEKPASGYFPCTAVLCLLKFEARLERIKCARLYFCFLKPGTGNAYPRREPETLSFLVCLEIFTVGGGNNPHLQVNDMQEFILPFRVTARKYLDFFFFQGKNVSRQQYSSSVFSARRDQRITFGLMRYKKNVINRLLGKTGWMLLALPEI